MTPDEFWTEFRKVASRFSVGENGLIRSEEMRCPICEVAYETVGFMDQEKYVSASIEMGLDYRTASYIADGADNVHSPLKEDREARAKMLAIMQEAKG